MQKSPFLLIFDSHPHIHDGAITLNTPLNMIAPLQSASVVCGGDSKGYTPVTLTYSDLKTVQKEGQLKTVPCFAMWSSGAQAEFYNTFDTKQFPNGVRTTVQRPNHPNIQADMQFDYQRKRDVEQSRQQSYQNSLQYMQNSTNRNTTTYCNYIDYQYFCNSY